MLGEGKNNMPGESYHEIPDPLPNREEIERMRRNYEDILLESGARIAENNRLHLSDEQLENAQTEKNFELYIRPVRIIEPWEAKITESRSFSQQEIYALAAQIDGVTPADFAQQKLVQTRDATPILLEFDLISQKVSDKYGLKTNSVSYEFRLKGDFTGAGVGTNDFTELWRYVDYKGQDLTPDATMSDSPMLPEAEKIAQFINGQWVTDPYLMDRHENGWEENSDPKDWE